MTGGPLSQDEIDAILRAQGDDQPDDVMAEDRDETGGRREDVAGANPEDARGTSSEGSSGAGEDAARTKLEGGPAEDPTSMSEVAATAMAPVWPEPESPLSDEDMDVLAEIANISMGSAATAASTLVQRKVTITAPSVSVSTPHDVWEQFELPTVVVEVGYVEGLKGRSLFILRPRDAAVIADLMMGNDGRNPPEELDDLHMSAVAEAMNQMMGASSTAMSDFFNLRVNITAPTAQLTEAGDRSPLASQEPMAAVSFWLRIEDLIDSNFVQLMPFPFAMDLVRMARRAVSGEAGDDAGALAVSGADTLSEADALGVDPTEETMAREKARAAMEARSEAGATAAMGPAASEPVQPAVFSPFDSPSEEGPPPPPGPLHNVSLDLVRHIPVEITASLGETEMSVKDLLRLTTGALVQLNTQEHDLIRIYANGVEIARGEVVVVGEQYGVRITTIVGPTQRLHSLGP